MHLSKCPAFSGKRRKSSRKPLSLSEACKQLLICRLPQVLRLHLKRFRSVRTPPRFYLDLFVSWNQDHPNLFLQSSAPNTPKLANCLQTINWSELNFAGHCGPLGSDTLGLNLILTIPSTLVQVVRSESQGEDRRPCGFWSGPEYTTILLLGRCSDAAERSLHLWPICCSDASWERLWLRALHGLLL